MVESLPRSFFFSAFLLTSTLSLSRVHEKHTFLPVQRKVYRVNKLQTDRTSTVVSSEILSFGTRPYFRKPFVALNDKKERLGARAFCPKTLHSASKCITLTSQTFWYHKALTSIKKSIRGKMGFKKALKTLEILEKPEVIFNRRLNSNPFHPFKKVGKNSKYFIKYHFRALTWRVIIFAILRDNSRSNFSL